MKSFKKLSEKTRQDLNVELSDSVKNNDIKSVKQALAAGASVETWHDQQTVLYRAVDNGNLEIAELLLLKGADPNSKAGGRAIIFPLHTATSNKNYKMMNLLLDFGANIDVEDNQKRTPMMIARSHYFSAACRAVFLDYLAEKRDPAQCYFNRGKKVAIASIDRGLNSSGTDVEYAKKIKMLCQKKNIYGAVGSVNKIPD